MPLDSDVLVATVQCSCGLVHPVPWRMLNTRYRNARRRWYRKAMKVLNAT